MRRSLKTFFLAIAAFSACLIAAVLAVYAVWYLNTPPRPPGDVGDAPFYVLLGFEMFIGLPVGLLTGVAAAAVVIWKRRRGSPANLDLEPAHEP